jgi:hypothetical protein
MTRLPVCASISLHIWQIPETDRAFPVRREQQQHRHPKFQKLLKSNSFTAQHQMYAYIRACICIPTREKAAARLSGGFSLFIYMYDRQDRIDSGGGRAKLELARFWGASERASDFEDWSESFLEGEKSSREGKAGLGLGLFDKKELMTGKTRQMLLLWLKNCFRRKV